MSDLTTRAITIKCRGRSWEIAPSIRSIKILLGFSLLAAVIAGVVKATAQGQCQSPVGSSESVCSLSAQFTDFLCPPDYQTYQQTCLTTFSEIYPGSRFYQQILNNLTSPLSSPQVNQEMLNALNLGCAATIPQVNSTIYPDCQGYHLTMCVDTAWQVFLSLLTICKDGSSNAAGISAALLLIVGIGAFLWDATKISQPFNIASSRSLTSNTPYGAVGGPSHQ